MLLWPPETGLQWTPGPYPPEFRNVQVSSDTALKFGTCGQCQEPGTGQEQCHREDRSSGHDRRSQERALRMGTSARKVKGVRVARGEGGTGAWLLSEG